MKRSVILFAGLGIWQASVAKGQVQTPEQLAGGVVGGQIYTSADAQEYYMGTVSSGQTVTGNIVGGVYPNQPSLSWYKYISDGVTPVTFDMYGTQMAYGYNGFGASNDGELAVFDSQGNFVAENKGSSIPSTGDSNVPAVIPAGAPNPPVSDTIRQPLNPNQPEYEYESGEGWFNTNDQGLANLNFVNNPQSNPAFAPTSSSYNWNQYSILPAGTYFLAVTGYSSYFSGSPTDASSLNSYYAKYLADKANGDDDGEGGVNSTTPFGFYLLHAMTGTYQLNARITGDFNGDGVADLADLRLLRLQTAEYLPTQGIAGAGYADGSADGSAWVGLPSNTSSPLTDLQQYDLTGNSRIDQNDIAAWGRYTNQSTVVSLTWNNTAAAPGTDPYNPGGPGDGITWDLETSQNFNDTIGTDVFFNGDLVTFNDNNNGNYAVTLNTTVSPGAMTVNNSAGDYVISGTGSIAGSTSLLKTGSSKLTLSTVNTYSGGTNVSGGTLALTVTGALPVNSPLTIGAGATVVAVNHGNGPKVVLQTSSLSIAGSTNSWTGLLDLTNNDLIAHNGSLSQITNQIKSGYASNWQGSTGITSSAAAADSTRLTALGAIQNSINGTPAGTAIYSTFDGATVSDSDVLVKYTYYGDTNLDGKVDGTDYSRIDNGALTHATGWFNGDFNYDGIINGSDYTLIDNAFNTQGAILASAIADSTAEIAPTSVPEPALASFAIAAGIALLGRRLPRTNKIEKVGKSVFSPSMASANITDQCRYQRNPTML